MEIYESILIQDVKGKLFLLLENVEANITQHINEGAIPIRGGRGNPIIGMVGGKNYISLQCFDVADKINDKFGNEKVNFYINKGNVQNQILNALIQYKGNDILVETEKMTVIKV